MDTDAHSAAFEALKADYSVLMERTLAAEHLANGYRERLAQLEHELGQLKRLVFGVRSERFEPVGGEGQLPLFAPSPVVAMPAGQERRARPLRTEPRQKPRRQVLPSHLPREVIVIEPEVDTSALKKIGEEVSETLDWRPAKLVVIRRVRPKYVHLGSRQEGVVIGELPARPIEKAIAEPGLLAHLLISKYIDHLPYYRQGAMFKRDGITLATSTLGGWGTAAVNLLAPLYDALTAQMQTSGYIQADETPIAVQDRSKKGKTHRGYYWVYLAPTEGLVCVDYQPGRGRAGPDGWLSSFKGALHSDGYVVYDDYDALERITAYNCFAHARRHFHTALESAPGQAEVALGEIQKLYEIERELLLSDPSAENRRRVRQQEAMPILADFKTWLEANTGLPKSPWGQAVAYTLTRWDKLTRYTEDGRIEIDTNLVENAIRPIALGRKNYLFAGSHDAAQRAAIVYSLLGTCKRHNVNPQIWLSDVLSRIATHPMKRIHELLPHLWDKGNR